MKIKHLLLVFVVLLIAIGVSACTLPASTPPPATPTDAGQFPVPGTQTMGLFESIATQTALAREQGEDAPEETPAPQETVEQAQETPAPTPQPEPEQPTATQAATAQLPELEIPTTYTLQKGEYPYCIARRFDLNPAELLRSNGLNVNSTTFPGRELKIPQNGGSFPGARSLRSHPATYTVRAGDTIYSVACTFGDVDPLAIAAVNELSSPYTLTTGQTLQIP